MTPEIQQIEAQAVGSCNVHELLRVVVSRILADVSGHETAIGFDNEVYHLVCEHLMDCLAVSTKIAAIGYAHGTNLGNELNG